MEIKEYLLPEDSQRNLDILKSPWKAIKIFNDKVYIQVDNGSIIKIEVDITDIMYKFECFRLLITIVKENIVLEITDLFSNGIKDIEVISHYEWIEPYKGDDKFIGHDPLGQNKGKLSDIPKDIGIICKVEDCLYLRNNEEELIIKCGDFPYSINFVKEKEQIKDILQNY